MKNIEAAFGNIGDLVSCKHGKIERTTFKEGFQITGFESLDELHVVADQRGHIIDETAMTISGEWVYTYKLN